VIALVPLSVVVDYAEWSFLFDIQKAGIPSAVGRVVRVDSFEIWISSIAFWDVCDVFDWKPDPVAPSVPAGASRGDLRSKV
jgi:hypothetical protein